MPRFSRDRPTAATRSPVSRTAMVWRTVAHQSGGVDAAAPRLASSCGKLNVMMLIEGSRMPNQMPASLDHLLQTQWLGSLSTHRSGQPYASLVAFACSEDGKRIWFATPRATRKYHNITADPRAAMLIDSRTNTAEDFSEACACTAVGTIVELENATREQALAVYLKRLPQLRDFVRSPSCAMLELDVTTYVIVCRFQDVTEFSP